MRGTPPLIILKWWKWNASHKRTGPWRQHFDDESWRGNGYAFLAESTFCVSLFCGKGALHMIVVCRDRMEGGMILMY